jgi:hypothetical protein
MVYIAQQFMQHAFVLIITWYFLALISFMFS